MSRARGGVQSSMSSASCSTTASMLPPALSDANGRPIRLNSPRLKEAMLETGVTKQNLMLRPKEAFLKQGKNVVMKEIAEKRFDVAESLRDENVRRVLEARQKGITDNDRKLNFRDRYKAKTALMGFGKAKKGSPRVPHPPTTPRDEGARKLVDERKRIDRQLEAAKKKADHNEELRRQHELHVQAEYKEQCKRDEEEAEAKVRHKHELLKRRYQREQEEQERLRRKEKETEEELNREMQVRLGIDKRDEIQAKQAAKVQKEALEKQNAFNNKHLTRLQKYARQREFEEAKLARDTRKLAQAHAEKESRKAQMYASRCEEIQSQNESARREHDKKKQKQVDAEHARREQKRLDREESIRQTEARLLQLEADELKERKRLKREDYAKRRAARRKKKEDAASLIKKKMEEHAEKWSIADQRHEMRVQEERTRMLIKAEDSRLANQVKEEAVQRDIRQKAYRRQKNLARVQAQDNQLKKRKAEHQKLLTQRAENAKHFLIERQKMREEEEQNIQALRFSAQYYGEKKKYTATEQKENAMRLATSPRQQALLKDDASDATHGIISEHQEFMSRARLWLRGGDSEVWDSEPPERSSEKDTNKAGLNETQGSSSSVRFPQLV